MRVMSYHYAYHMHLLYSLWIYGEWLYNDCLSVCVCMYIKTIYAVIVLLSCRCPHLQYSCACYCRAIGCLNRTSWNVVNVARIHHGVGNYLMCTHAANGTSLHVTSAACSHCIMYYAASENSGPAKKQIVKQSTSLTASICNVLHPYCT